MAHGKLARMWKETLDKVKVLNKAEYEKYERRLKKEIQKIRKRFNL